MKRILKAARKKTQAHLNKSLFVQLQTSREKPDRSSGSRMRLSYIRRKKMPMNNTISNKLSFKYQRKIKIFPNKIGDLALSIIT